MDNKTKRGMLDTFIHHFWAPYWHYLKLENLIPYFKNIDNFCINTELNIKLNEEDREDIKLFLMVEVIASVMFTAECFAAIADACISNPKNIQAHMRNFKAANFYNRVGSMKENDYAAIFSLPKTEKFDKQSKKMLKEAIQNLKGVSEEVKSYYFSNLDLFNAYKHGFRIFTIRTVSPSGKEQQSLAFFSKKHKDDSLTLLVPKIDYKEHRELSIKMLRFIDMIVRNNRACFEEFDKLGKAKFVLPFKNPRSNQIKN